MKNYALLLIVTLIFIVGIWLTDDEQLVISGKIPTPTEFDIKKSKRKDFKNQRKEYMKNMHRAHPDDDWIKMDLYYIDNWSLWLDVKILLKTIYVVLLAKGSY